MTVTSRPAPTASCRIMLDRPEAKNALTLEMRDDDRRRGARRSAPTPTVRALLITGDRRRVLRGHGPRARRRSRRPASPGFDARTHVGGAARRRAGVHPRAVGARQADGRRGQRRRGRARARTSRSRATSCSSHPTTRFMWSFAPLGPRRRRRRRVPAPPPRRAAARQGDGDARRGLRGRRGRRPRARVQVRRRRRAARPARPRRWPPSSPPARPGRSACRSGCSTRASRPTSRDSLELEGAVPVARDHVVTTSSRAWPRSSERRDPELHRSLTYSDPADRV